MEVVKRITPTIFAYQGDMYETDKNTLDRYVRLKTIRNLLSRSRLLNSVESKQVRPHMVTLVGFLCDGKSQIRFTGNVENEILRLKRMFNAVVVIFKTAKIPMAVAQDIIDAKMTFDEIEEQVKVVFRDEKSKL